MHMSGLPRSRLKNGAVYGHTSGTIPFRPASEDKLEDVVRHGWHRSVKDLDQLGISTDDVPELAADGAPWRGLIHGATHLTGLVWPVWCTVLMMMKQSAMQNDSLSITRVDSVNINSSEYNHY